MTQPEVDMSPGAHWLYRDRRIEADMNLLPAEMNRVDRALGGGRIVLGDDPLTHTDNTPKLRALKLPPQPKTYDAGKSRESYSYFVPGRPAPKGSHDALAPGVTRNASIYLPAWEASVEFETRRHVGTCIAAPISVSLQFVLKRPKRLRTQRPEGPPDLDKLIRGTLDPIEKAGAILDDSGVCWIAAGKRYAQPGEETGCHVTLGGLT